MATLIVVKYLKFKKEAYQTLFDQIDYYYQTFVSCLLMNDDSELGYYLQGDSVVHANGRYKLDLTCHCIDVCDFDFQQTQLMKILNTRLFRSVMILRLQNGTKIILKLHLIFLFCLICNWQDHDIKT